MQIANGDHVWRVEVESEWVYLQKQYTHDGDEFWEKELSVEIIEHNVEQVYAYLREYVSHKPLCLDLTKDVWYYARERQSEEKSADNTGDTV
jgi:hypothetical protein